MPDDIALDTDISWEVSFVDGNFEMKVDFGNLDSDDDQSIFITPSNLNPVTSSRSGSEGDWTLNDSLTQFVDETAEKLTLTSPAWEQFSAVTRQLLEEKSIEKEHTIENIDPNEGFVHCDSGFIDESNLSNDNVPVGGVNNQNLSSPVVIVKEVSS